MEAETLKTFFSHKVPSKHYRVVHFITVITGTLSNQRVVHFGVDKHIITTKQVISDGNLLFYLT